MHRKVAGVDAPLEDVDQELVHEFLDEFLEKQEEIEKDLMALETEPTNQGLIDNIFRAVHTIKGNAGICKFTAVIEFSHALEDMLQALRSGKIFFSSQLSEVVLLSMDRLRALSEAYLPDNELTLDECQQNEKISQALRSVTDVSSGEVYSAIQYVLSLLSANFETIDVDFDFTFYSDPDISAERSTKMERDLDLFNVLMKQTEQRSIFWQGRGERCLSLVMEMNAVAGAPVDAYELTAAVYLHDFGMGMLPEFVIAKSSPLDEQEQMMLRQHPVVASQLIDRLEGWQGGREIVLQHHEREDGNGYPQGLAGESICEGAKLIAIADAFVSLTRPRADRMHKRSVMQAVVEINKHKGTQFSSSWVAVFNTVMRQRYLDN